MARDPHTGYTTLRRRGHAPLSSGTLKRQRLRQLDQFNPAIGLTALRGGVWLRRLCGAEP